MAASINFSLIAIVCLCSMLVVDGQQQLPPSPSCGKCDKTSCPRPTGCLAGIGLDRCACCHVCALIEGEKCDNDSLPLPYKNAFGHCGDQLECRLRDDLKQEDPLEAICFCKETDVLCGTDGKTYMNSCQLTEQAYRLRNGLKAATRGPCKSAPWIVSGPEERTAGRGTNVALSCEGMGFPIPSIEWQMTRLDGETINLPRDDQHIAVQARGGPERFEVTGWLQILNFQDEDNGLYHCIAVNPEGSSKMSAQVTLVEKADPVEADENLNLLEAN